MKSKILHVKTLLFSILLLALAFFAGCSDDEAEVRSSGYGYVQFKLFKSGAYQQLKETRAGTNELEYLSEAQKMKIVLIHDEDGTEIVQTVSLRAMGENAELGLRSEKLQLVVGSYTVVGFYLYGIKGQELVPILSGEPEERTLVQVVDGGWTVQDLAVKVVERGNLKFVLTKKIVSETASVDAADKFLFSDIRYANIIVRNKFSKVTESFDNIPFKYMEKIGVDKRAYAVLESDSSLILRAGMYEIAAYVLRDKNKRTLDGDNVEQVEFEIADNQEIDVTVPVKLYRSASRILDYIALQNIWLALDGPNWKYSGTDFPKGCNWNFDQDMDMWGNQPGVSLDATGRVTGLTLGGFGGRGDIPADLGQLTELKILYLGTHAEQAGDNMIDQWDEITPESLHMLRMDYYNKFLKEDIRSTASDLCRMAFEMQGKAVGCPDVWNRRQAEKKDVAPGNLTNGIRGVPKEIGRLTKLQQLYIACGKFADFEAGTDLSALKALRDLEFYNNPSMTRIPDALFTIPNIEALNLANNPQIEPEVFDEALVKLATGVSKDKVQLLYLGHNRLTRLPDEFRNLVKLGLLDCTHNQIRTVPVLGKAVNPVQLLMSYNQIEEIPRDAEGYFCGYEDVETVSFAHNKLKKVPNIFDAQSVYVIGSADFSFNEITEFEDGDNFRGINATTLSLGGNRLKTFPGILFQKNSQIDILLLNGNGIEEFPKGSLEGKETYHLQTLDLTYNKLSKLPDDFDATKLPYLYGCDLSNNRFASFPTEPLGIDHLTAFGLRNQRDEAGNRTIRDWPEGISQCPSLRALLLAGNDLRKITEKISPRISIFEIKDNPNISLDLSNICPYIKAGVYQLIYDPTQDIRGCDALDLE